MQKKEDSIQAVILDMDGVIWKSFQPIGNIHWIYQTLQDLEIKIALATNNSSKTRGQYQQKLAKIGMMVQENQIYTSSIAMARLLKRDFPQGGPVFVIGEDGLHQPLSDYGFYHREHDVLAVVSGLDRSFTFEKLNTATFLIRSGAKFYGTNPDRTFPTPQGFGPGAGALLAAIEAATDMQPTLAGKPSPQMIHTILNDLGVSPAQTLVIGDRLETDIKAGQSAGCKTGLVLSGVSTLADLQAWEPKTDYVAVDLENLVREYLL